MISLHRISVFLLCLIGVLSFTPTLPTHAASFTAVQNWYWDDSSNWGGSSIPQPSDDVTIPVGITVTIYPSEGRKGQTTINGTLVADNDILNIGNIDNNGIF